MGTMFRRYYRSLRNSRSSISCYWLLPPAAHRPSWFGCYRAFKFTFLQRTQKLRLHLDRFLNQSWRYLQRALIGEFKPSGLLRNRACEGASFMSKTRALEHSDRNRSTVELYKAPPLAPPSTNFPSCHKAAVIQGQEQGHSSRLVRVAQTLKAKPARRASCISVFASPLRRPGVVVALQPKVTLSRIPVFFGSGAQRRANFRIAAFVALYTLKTGVPMDL
jgi:hypothetical protein